MVVTFYIICILIRSVGHATLSPSMMDMCYPILSAQPTHHNEYSQNY